jgi:hypothetical protein
MMYGGVDAKFHAFVNSTMDKKVVKLAPRLGGALEPVWSSTEWKYVFPAGKRTPIAQPLARI